MSLRAMLIGLSPSNTSSSQMHPIWVSKSVQASAPPRASLRSPSVHQFLSKALCSMPRVPMTSYGPTNTSISFLATTKLSKPKVSIVGRLKLGSWVTARCKAFSDVSRSDCKVTVNPILQLGRVHEMNTNCTMVFSLSSPHPSSRFRVSQAEHRSQRA